MIWKKKLTPSQGRHRNRQFGCRNHFRTAHLHGNQGAKVYGLPQIHPSGPTKPEYSIKSSLKRKAQAILCSFSYPRLWHLDHLMYGFCCNLSLRVKAFGLSCQKYGYAVSHMVSELWQLNLRSLPATGKFGPVFASLCGRFCEAIAPNMPPERWGPYSEKL